MDKSGKWLILAILAIALASGGFSWWFRWSATHRAADFWGPEVSTFIRDAKRVGITRRATELNELSELDENRLTLELDYTQYIFEPPQDVSKGRGLVHLRQALLQDRSYHWQGEPNNEYFEPHWVLSFKESIGGNRGVIIVFDENCTRCRYYFSPPGTVLPVRSPTINCEPISAGLKEVFSEWTTP